MGIEIERKFLVVNEQWREQCSGGILIRQGYLALGPPTAVRVRLAGGHATLNVKTATVHIARNEFEYGIPLGDGEAMLEAIRARHIIEKTRYEAVFDGLTWEIDEFHGANKGLIVAELELDSVGQTFSCPEWIGEEVSHDPRYLNTHLSRHPYMQWARPEHSRHAK